MAIAIEINLIDGFTYYLNRLKHVVILKKERRHPRFINCPTNRREILLY